MSLNKNIFSTIVIALLFDKEEFSFNLNQQWEKQKRGETPTLK